MGKSGQSFAAGAATLMASAVVVKIIGMMFKIPLTRMLGGEGMGYYMTAYSIFNPACALCVAGIPVAVSRLTAECLAGSHRGDLGRILSTALGLFLPAGLLCTVGMYAAAPRLVALAGNPAALGAVRAIAPALVFCCISAVFRGYYEGAHNMIPTAASQVVEAAVKLGAGIYATMRCLQTELAHFYAGEPVCGFLVQNLEEAHRIIAPYAAAAAMMGVTLSTVAATLALVLAYLREPQTAPLRPGFKPGGYARGLAGIAFPVCLGALLINLSSLADLMLVMNRLNAAAASGWEILCRGYPGADLQRLEPERAANFLYGSYSGLTLTVFHLVPALTSSLGISALPLVASLAARGNGAHLRRVVESVLRITVIVALPLGLGLSCMARPVLALLFSSNPQEVAVAEVLLRRLGAAAVLVSVSGCISSMLQALGRVLVPVRLMLIGTLVRLGINWALIARPEINIMGAPLGTLASYLLVTWLAFAALEREIAGRISLPAVFLKPLAASLCCCAAAWGVHRLAQQLLGHLALLPAVLAAGVLYPLLLLVLRAFREEDLELMPKRMKIRRKDRGRMRNSLANPFIMR